MARRKRTSKSSQKTKRIRKNKKEYFRGTLTQFIKKSNYPNFTTSLTFRYIILFSLLALAVLLFPYLTFLLSRFHNLQNLVSLLSVSTLLISHIHLFIPTISFPRIALPEWKFSLWLLSEIGQQTLWFFEVVKEYLILVETIVSVITIFVLKTTIITTHLLWQVVIYSFSTVSQTLITVLLFLNQLIEIVEMTIATMLVAIVVFIITILISITQVIRYIFVLLATAVFNGILVIFQWIMHLLATIKRNLDNTFDAIGAFIHQFEPEYTFVCTSIVESINSLFRGIGKVVSVKPSFLNSGS